MNNILAIDAATNLLSICLKQNDSFYEITLDCGLKHSENLILQIENLLSTAEITPADLDLLVTSRGPGSFTGLRIAMATVKGIATGLNIPYVTVPTLDYLAKGLEYFNGPVVPLIDAKKKRFYCAVYLNGSKKTDPLDISTEKIENLLDSYKTVLLTGPDCYKIELSRKDGILRDGNHFEGKSRQLLNLGIQKFLNEGSDPINSGPVYIRKSEAEIAMFGE